MKIAVFGAHGATGHEIITQAISRGVNVIAITRNPQRFSLKHPAVKVVKADATDPAQVQDAIKGVDAIISVVGTSFSHENITVYSSSARSYLAAMEKAGVNRLIVTSSSAVSSWEDPQWALTKRFLVRQVLSRLGRTLYADMRCMEDIVSSSSCRWTIIRPSGLATIDSSSGYEVAQDHIGGSYTARQDLATALLDAALSDKWVGQKVAVASVGKSLSLVGTIWREGIKPRFQK